MNDLNDIAVDILQRKREKSYTRPLPNLHQEPYAREFWEATTEERLLLQWCPDCETHQYFPRPWCVECTRLAEDLEWDESEGTGTVASYSVVSRTVSNPAFAGELPYVTAYVDLDEGVRMYSNVVNCDPEDVEIGLDVEVVFDHVTDEIALPKFQPR